MRRLLAAGVQACIALFFFTLFTWAYSSTIARHRNAEEALKHPVRPSSNDSPHGWTEKEEVLRDGRLIFAQNQPALDVENSVSSSLQPTVSQNNVNLPAYTTLSRTKSLWPWEDTSTSKSISSDLAPPSSSSSSPSGIAVFTSQTSSPDKSWERQTTRVRSGVKPSSTVVRSTPHRAQSTPLHEDDAQSQKDSTYPHEDHIHSHKDGTHVHENDIHSHKDSTYSPDRKDGDLEDGVPSEEQSTLVHEESTLVQAAIAAIEAIMRPNDTSYTQLECPSLSNGNTRRYERLVPREDSSSSVKPRYFFALDLHQCAPLLPRLLGSIIEAIRFLGPANCVLSIVEGRSTDGTLEVLDSSSFQSEIEALGARYIFTTNNVDPRAGNGVDRIQALSDLRNQALAPVVENPEEFHPDETTIVFINDVAICSEDILELLYQRVVQHADMTCAMDWIFGGSIFYDVWVSRGMNGDQFFEIPQSGSWDFAENLFWNAPDTRRSLEAGLPFQVFSCWNGAVTMTARPFMDGQVKFRTKHEGECYLGEPVHLAKDLWNKGYGRIAVVPSVNVGYDDLDTQKVKSRRGTVTSFLEKQETERETQRETEGTDNDIRGGKDKVKEETISWSAEPPRQIKCVTEYQRPSWVAWNQGL